MSSEESEGKLASSYTPRASGNWYSPCGKQSGITSREPSKCSYRWLTPTSGSLSHDNNQKEGKIIHEGIMGVLFSNGEKLELYRPEVGELFL